MKDVSPKSNLKKNKTAVILLGAGAALPWGGPSSSNIEARLFNNNEFKTEGNTKNLAEYIKDQLVELYKCEPHEINFEFILNSLESLAAFLSEKINHKHPRLHGSLSLWFQQNEKVFDVIRNYKFEHKDSTPDLGHLTNLSNNSGMGQYDKDKHEWVYFSYAIKTYIELIKDSIFEYDSKWHKPRKSTLNKNLKEFYDVLKKEGYFVRFYTTNYDSLFPNIFDRNFNVKLFDGFEPKNGADFPNIKRIITNRNDDCYYNLHGNIYWNYWRRETPYTNMLRMPTMQRDNFIPWDETTDIGEHTQIHGIVTGFHKLQKVTTEPLKAFFTSFANDCINANLISVIGYSYGDYHINRTLRDGIVLNDSKFLNITSANSSDEQRHRMIDGLLLMRRSSFPKDHSFRDCSVNDYKNTVYYKGGFETFLNKKVYMDLDFLY